MNDYERDPILIGLTRPPLIRGVGLNWMFLNVIGTMICFALSGSFFAVLLFPVFHLVGVLIYAKDPATLSIIFKRLKVGWTPNNKYWGGNSYNG